MALAPWGTPFAHLVCQHADVFAQLPAFIYQGMLAAYIRSAAHQPMDEATLQALMHPWLGDAGQAAFFRQIAQFDQHDTDEIEPRYRTMDVPVRLLWGAHDTWIPLERGQRLQQMLPQATLRVIANAGHLLLAEAPETVAQELATFFDGSGGSVNDHAAAPQQPDTLAEPSPPDADTIWAAQRAVYAQLKPDLPFSWRAPVFQRATPLMPAQRDGTSVKPTLSPGPSSSSAERWCCAPTCCIGNRCPG